VDLPRVALRRWRPLGPVLFSKVTAGGDMVSTMIGAGVGGVGGGTGGVGVGLGVSSGTIVGPSWGTTWDTIAGTGMASGDSIVMDNISGVHPPQRWRRLGCGHPQR
jgi:hypothetical protein